MNIEDLFIENLYREQSENTIDELEQCKALQEFAENIWNVHHSNEGMGNVGCSEDEEIQIGKTTGDILLCPFSKVRSLCIFNSRTLPNQRASMQNLISHQGKKSPIKLNAHLIEQNVSYCITNPCQGSFF